MPDRGLPREQYPRTYVLLPPGANAVWAQAVVEATWDEHRWTVGGSADDSAIGDLDVRRIIAVNPALWLGDLRAFYDEHYPGVEYHAIEAATPTELVEKLSETGEGPGEPNDDPNAESEPVLIGFNDWPPGGDADNGCRWLRENGLGGIICQPLFVGTDAQMLDYSAAQAAGIRVIVNLRYSYSTDKGGRGTLPPEGGWEWSDFVKACNDTIASSRGVWGWTIGNEPNNPREWPAATVLTPGYWADIYDEIWYAIAADVRLAPGAIDPFYGPNSDCREWFRQIYKLIDGANFIPLHGYIRGPDSTLCWSSEKFEHPPLQWQALNYLDCCKTLLATLPSRYSQLPVVITEFNHIWIDHEPNNGWVQDARAADVVRAAYQRADQRNAVDPSNPIMGICLYRWEGDEWALKENRSVLDAVKAVGA